MYREGFWWILLTFMKPEEISHKDSDQLCLVYFRMGPLNFLKLCNLELMKALKVNEFLIHNVHN